MIDLQNVSYSYESSPVLKNLTLQEDEPVIMGLWGRNGAGKTTLMKLIAGLYAPEEGKVDVYGLKPYNNDKAQESICFMQEDHPFHPMWRIKDILQLAEHFYPDWNKETADHLMKVFQLPEKKRVGKFSKGMKTAVQLIIGISSHAKVTIFDEPTNGLDAVIRKKFYHELLQSYEDHPRLIMISSHHINEVQPLCESIAVVYDKKIKLYEPMEELRERGVFLTGDQKAIDQLTSGMTVMEKDQLGLTAKVMVDAAYRKDIIERAKSLNISVEKPSLQDYLINITEPKKEELLWEGR
ncbi:ATP-binding cassette domain-containing protein [Bacillus gobiensis]|uniref:ABC transporter ATP-binding protein n=1 Tax=Bacillus gobiensis TaxID=1441095 RepID=UPI003D241348